jgi:AraC family transcriptional regulator
MHVCCYQRHLQQAIDYIHTHLNRDLSLVELASVVNISPTYFASLFKRATRISPHPYVIQQRVERAKLMLSKTDLAIAKGRCSAPSRTLPYKWVSLAKAI